MLLRFYRLTDKLGIVILKLGASVADWFVDGIYVLTNVTGRSTGGIFGGLLALLMLILRGIGAVLRAITTLIARLFSGFVTLVGIVANGVRRLFGIATSRTQQAGSAVVKASSSAMARRAARDEIDVTLTEDPLRVQNRRLSFLVLILGVAVLAAVIWATDPNRTQQPMPVAAAPINNNTALDAAPIATDAETNIVNTAPTVIPTATPLPQALSARGAVAYTVRENGQTDIWAVDVGSANPIRITNNPADERDPQWSADGTRLAYAARIDGNWDLYVYDLLQNATGRVTVDISFQANPTWDPAGIFLAYENYQGENLDIYAVPIDASQPPRAITEHPAPDFSPAWGPDGRSIAFTSLRDGNQDIYVVSLEDLTLTNITNTPNINEDHAAWSPDGRSLAYSAREAGAPSATVFVQAVDNLDALPPPQVIAVGRTPAWSPDGTGLAYAVDSLDGRRTDMFSVAFGESTVPFLLASVASGSTSPTWTPQPLPATLVNSGGLPPAITEPLYIEQTDTFNGDDFQLQSLAGVQTDQALLSDAVNESFEALQEATFAAAGVDFLSVLDDAFWSLERPADFGEPGRNWHRTGRAFAIPRNSIRGFPPPVEVVREDIGNQVFWRVYLRVEENTQRGQLGEPMRELPWDFLATTQGDVDAFNQGGRLRREVPTGYYIDLTQLAADYDWERVPAGSDWVANTRARNFWLFINDNNLTWCAAMLQLYSEGELVNYQCTQ